MKKFAMMLMNPLFDSEKHKAVFQTGNIENHIVTVRKKRLKKHRHLYWKALGYWKYVELLKKNRFKKC